MHIVKCFAFAKREIMCKVALQLFLHNCEISRLARCEMKFAHVRASGHFTFAEQIFHRKAISLARKGKFRCVPALWQVRRCEGFIAMYYRCLTITVYIIAHANALRTSAGVVAAESASQYTVTSGWDLRRVAGTFSVSSQVRVSWIA